MDWSNSDIAPLVVGAGLVYKWMTLTDNCYTKPAPLQRLEGRVLYEGYWCVPKESP